MLRKLKRTFTSILPISKKRRGKCVACGACCKLPNRCPFLRYDRHGRSRCAAYAFRPPNCRKYPRTNGEHITKDTCGFTFEDSPAPQSDKE